MKNRKANLLFIKHYKPFRISNRKWLVVFNRSGDVALHKCRRSANQNRWKNHSVRAPSCLKIKLHLD